MCGTRIVEGVETAAGSGGECESDGKTAPLIVNGKWIPYVMTYGALDELVPFTGGLEQVEDFNKLGYRYYALLYPAEDHLVFASQNDFAPATSQLGERERVQDPGSFTFTWYPELDSSALGHRPERRLLGERASGAQQRAGCARHRDGVFGGDPRAAGDRGTPHGRRPTARRRR